jgi:hypothetical protein
VNEVRTSSTAVLGAAAASVAAALVHAAAAGTHGGASELVTLFAVTAAVQAVVAGAVAFSPTRASLLAVAAVNTAAVAAWGFSRTTGLPWPELLNEAEDVSAQDLAAASLGAVAALLAGIALAAPRWAAARNAPTALAGAACTALLAIAVPGMAAQHAHGEGSHDHAHEGEEVAAGGVLNAQALDDHADDGHAHGDEATITAEAATGPIISLDDPRVTDEQRAAAQELIDETTAGMAQFTDEAAVQAAGYISIGDGATGYEHYIHVGYIADGIDLDPNKIESIVFTVAPDGTKTVASAMYILGFGATMDDVPDIAGELTTWHDHQNLCWEGARVVGTTDATGSCQRGVFRATPPMLHVWMPGQEPACGPFAGIEGSHGSDCGDHGH